MRSDEVKEVSTAGGSFSYVRVIALGSVLLTFGWIVFSGTLEEKGGGFGPAGGYSYETWHHGWPGRFLERTVFDENSTRYAIWQGQWDLDGYRLLGDIAVLVGVVAFVLLIWGIRIVHGPSSRGSFTYTIGEVLLGILVFGTLLGQVSQSYSRAERERSLGESLAPQGHFAEYSYIGPEWLKRFIGDRVMNEHFLGISAMEITGEKDAKAISSILSSLSGMPDLRKVSLIECSVSDGALKPLLATGNSRPPLQEMTFRKCEFTEDGILALIAADGFLSGLRTLDLSGSNIGDDEMSRLVSANKLSDLHTLLLSETPITGAFLADADALSNLTKISLASSRLNDEGFRHLMEIPSLEFIEAYDTDITGDALAKLKAPVHLQELDVAETYITEQDCAELRRQGVKCWTSPR